MGVMLILECFLYYYVTYIKYSRYSFKDQSIHRGRQQTTTLFYTINLLMNKVHHHHHYHHLSRETSTAGHRPPQSSPRRSVLRCPHPAASRDLHRIVGPPCGGPTNAASPVTWSPFEDLSAPTAVSSRNVPCPLPLEVCNSSGYVGAGSDLSSFTDLIVSNSIT
jgi:hypothetical protein